MVWPNIWNKTPWCWSLNFQKCLAIWIYNPLDETSYWDCFRGEKQIFQNVITFRIIFDLHSFAQNFFTAVKLVWRAAGIFWVLPPNFSVLCYCSLSQWKLWVVLFLFLLFGKTPWKFSLYHKYETISFEMHTLRCGKKVSEAENAECNEKWKLEKTNLPSEDDFNSPANWVN